MNRKSHPRSLVRETTRPAAPAILVVGSANTDMILRLDQLPRPGETLLGGRFATAQGGKGANQAVAAARAGGRVTFVARLGSDPWGDRALEGYRGDGIDVGHVVRDAKEPSGTAFIFVARGGENCIGVAPGANAKLSAADVRNAAGAFRGADVLLTQLESPPAAVAAAARLAARHGVPVILNPAPARPVPDALLRLVSIITPNETEAGVLTGIRVRDEASAARAAECLLGRGAGAAVITLGARGAYVAAPGIRTLVPGFEVKAVDTTAAGDVFNGALAMALAGKRALPDAVRFANAAAALSVMRHGAQPSAPVRARIERLLRRK